MTFPATTGSDLPGEVFNRSALLARIGGHGAMIPRFVGMFLESVENCLSELDRAVSAEDLDAVRKAAHTLKGVSANIGADRIHAAALDMGELARVGDREGLRNILAKLHGECELFTDVVSSGADEAETSP